MAMSSSVSSKSKSAKFSSIRSRCIDFGKMMSPRCRCQRRVDLGRGAAEALGDRPDRLVVGDPAPRDRRPRLGGDAVARVGGAGRLVGEVGVHLDLVHRRYHAGLVDDPVEVGGLEVRDTDRSVVPPPSRSSTRVRQVETKSPSYRVGSGQWMRNRSTWSSPSLSSDSGERAARVVGAVEAVVELGGDVELVARDAGGLDRGPDLGLVAVHLGGVDVAVAHLERLLDGPLRLLGRHQEDAEAELGDLRCRR